MSMDKKREISSFQTEKKDGPFLQAHVFYERPSKKTTLFGIPCIKWNNERTGGSEIIENQVPHLKDLNEIPRQSKMKFLLHEEFFFQQILKRKIGLQKSKEEAQTSH